ncbi:MAG: substrate-binding domain-containing protein [bacterium]|nr:substrate-binding domain-containing protein [bacterium]
MKLRKFVALAVTVTCVAGSLAACGGKDKAAGWDSSKSINVASREDGSGTRGAFVELFGIEEKDASGNKVDRTKDSALITNSTSVMMQTVSGDKYGLGYISLGSLNDTVKAVKIDGAEATVDNIKSGKYTIARPFNIATKGTLSEAAQDFVDYIMSKDGQQVITDSGYISVSEAEAFKSKNPTGKVVIAGSSSVTPVMEKLKEAYEKINTGVKIELQESDSTTGMKSTIDGICDIGMASRELKDSELSEGITGTKIAMDGIAVIVNTSSTVDNLTKDQVKSIYVGDTTSWSDIVK